MDRSGCNNGIVFDALIATAISASSSTLGLSTSARSANLHSGQQRRSQPPTLSTQTHTQAPAQLPRHTTAAGAPTAAPINGSRTSDARDHKRRTNHRRPVLVLNQLVPAAEALEAVTRPPRVGGRVGRRRRRPVRARHPRQGQEPRAAVNEARTPRRSCLPPAALVRWPPRPSAQSPVGGGAAACRCAPGGWWFSDMPQLWHDRHPPCHANIFRAGRDASRP